MIKKQDLINKYADIKGLTKKDAGEVIDTVFDLIKDAIINEGGLDIYGFGKFEVVQRAERKGRNPQTGQEITIKASKAPKFKPAKALKDVINQ